MFQELIRSPCWLCSTIALLFVAHALVRTVYEMADKRWSLTTIAKRLARIERKVDVQVKQTKPPKALVRRGSLRLVHSVPDKKKRSQKPPSGSGPTDAA